MYFLFSLVFHVSKRLFCFCMLRCFEVGVCGAQGGGWGKHPACLCRWTYITVTLMPTIFKAIVIRYEAVVCGGGAEIVVVSFVHRSVCWYK